MHKPVTSITILGMRTLFITLALVGFGCGGNGNKAVDAAPPIDVAPPIDTASQVDAPPLTLDCNSYCTTIAANCTGLNAQYGGANAVDATAHCMATCAKFTPGALSDMSGNTLGCRIYHANNAKVTGMLGIHCPHAGPAGAAVNAATGTCGDPCLNFCTLEIAACGVVGAAPFGQYTDMNACMTACSGFDKAHSYTINGGVSPTVNPIGDSLACRLYHTTNALITGAAATHCPHTGPAGGGNQATCMMGTAASP